MGAPGSSGVAVAAQARGQSTERRPPSKALKAGLCDGDRAEERSALSATTGGKAQQHGVKINQLELVGPITTGVPLSRHRPVSTPRSEQGIELARDAPAKPPNSPLHVSRCRGPAPACHRWVQSPGPPPAPRSRGRRRVGTHRPAVSVPSEGPGPGALAVSGRPSRCASKYASKVVEGLSNGSGQPIASETQVSPPGASLTAAHLKARNREAKVFPEVAQYW